MNPAFVKNSIFYEPEHALHPTPEHPLISFILLSYNQEKFIREAVEGALSQTYSPLEIILSDDCSTDNTYAIMQASLNRYSGKHTVILRQNDKNMGMIPHFNLMMGLAKGDIIVGAAGDDISLPRRTESCWEIFSSQPDAGCVSSAIITIDSKGRRLKVPVLGDTISRLTLNEYLSFSGVWLPGSSRAYKKSVWNYFGNLSRTCPTEDTPMLLRSLMIGPGYLCGEHGVLYRIHGANVSSEKNIHRLSPIRISRQYLRDINLAAKNGIIAPYMLNKSRCFVRRKLNRRILANKLRTAPSKIWFFMAHILSSRAYTLKNKIKMSYAFAFKKTVNKIFGLIVRTRKIVSYEINRGYRLAKSTNGRKRVHAYWCDIPNFGDQITPLLIQHFGLSPFHDTPGRARLFATGSILERVPSRFSGIILGSGFINSSSIRKLSEARILAVRGKLSYEHIGAPDGIHLGDPGLLASVLLRERVEKRYDIGIIPHYADKNNAVYTQLEKTLGEKILLIDPRSNPIKVFSDIDKCAHILSSSLHGLIVSDSLNIPNAWLACPCLSGGRFKFDDYYSSLDLSLNPVYIHGDESISQLISLTSRKPVDKIDTLRQGLYDMWSNLANYL